MLVLALALGGCLSTKSYVLPALPRVNYGDLQATQNLRPVVLVTEFQVGGVPEMWAGTALRERVTEILYTAHVFSSVRAGPAPNTDTLEIILNNVGNLDTSSAVLTGLTFGVAGTKAVDGYVMTATFTRVGRPPVTNVYQHQMVTTIGVASGASGLVAMGEEEAIKQIIKDLLLNLILDLQKAGAL